MNYINITTKEYPITEGMMRAAHPNTLFPEPFCPHEGYAEVQYGEYPAFNKNTHKVLEVSPIETVDGYIQSFEVISLTPEEVSANLSLAKDKILQDLSAKRYSVETGGLLIGEVKVNTSIDDPNRIASVVASAELAGAQSVDFKASSGWVTLSIAELKGIAVLIAQHVQHCSATERQHFNNISSIQTIEELESYDLNSLWNTTV